MKQFSYFKKLINLTGYNRIYIVIILSILSSLSEGAGIFLFIPLLQIIIDGADVENESLYGKLTLVFSFFNIQVNLISVLLLMMIFFSVKGILSYATKYYMYLYRAYLINRLRLDLLNSFKKISLSYFLENDIGFYLNLIDEQSNRYIQSVHSFFHVIVSGSTAIIFFFFAILYHGLASLIILLILLPIIFVYKFLNNLILEKSEAFSYASSSLTTSVIELLKGYKYFKVTNSFGSVERQINSNLDKLKRSQISIGKLISIIDAVREPIIIFFLLIVVIYNHMYIGNSFASILVLIILLQRLLNSIMSIQSNWASSFEYAGSIDFINKIDKNMSMKFERIGNHPIPSEIKSLEFKKYNFKYPLSTNYTLKDITMSLNKNKITAILGHSGAGKSTLLDSISLINDSKNSFFYINDITGKDINVLDYRKLIGYVPQNGTILNTSIKYNLTLWNDIYSDKQILDIINSIGLNTLVETLPNGIYTKIGKDGVQLSGGQYQKILIARELIKKPLVLILDEPTSSLDMKSENEVIDIIKNINYGCFIIFTTHKANLLSLADNIFCIENGYVIEQGSFDDLRNNPNSFLNKLFLDESLNEDYQ